MLCGARRDLALESDLMIQPQHQQHTLHHQYIIFTMTEGFSTTAAATGALVIEEAQEQLPEARQQPRIQRYVRDVNNQEVCIELEAELSKNCYNQDQPATGHAVWFAAENLCGLVDQLFLEQKQQQEQDDLTEEEDSSSNNQGMTITSLLELGAGPGLTGIYAAKLLNKTLQTVVLTDGDADVVELLQRNINRNQILEMSGKTTTTTTTTTTAAQVLLWGNDNDNQALLERYTQNNGFSIILGADLIYGKCSIGTIQLLFQTVYQLLAPQHGIFYLAFTRRNLPISIVLKEANRQGLVWQLVDDFVYDIFDNNVDGTTDFWRDAIYAFSKKNDGDGKKQLMEMELQEEQENDEN